tara:strand:+ start:9106 stop:10617 length:1512 start_codon:yes stop_codon:yes gene_type:complete
MQISEFFEDKKPNQAKAKDKKPKMQKPSKGHQSPHPMRGKLVGEDVTGLNTEPKLGKLPHKEVEAAIHRWVNQDDHIELSNGMHILSGENHGYADNVALIVDQDYKIIDNDDDIVDLMQQFTAQEIDPDIVESKNKKLPKQNNPVAKHSRNMSGAGAHKSPKDYDRKKEKLNLKKELDEGEERSIIQDAVVDHLIDTFGGENWMIFADTREQLEARMYDEIETLSVDEVVDSSMEVGGQPIGNFASGRVLDVIDSSSAIESAMQHVQGLDEGTFVAQKSAIIDSILKKLKDEAQDDDEMLRNLAKMVMQKADPRSHNQPRGKWQLEPLEENASKEQIQAEIKRLQPIADKLEFGQGKARDITKAIKYENTTSEIMVGLSGLADELGIDEKELDYYERQVYDAKNKLESAVYEMEEVFEDKYKEVAYKIEELEMDLDDMEYEMKNESTEMMTEEQFDEAAGEKDACYHKVKSRYKVWPSAYASGALVQCRKKGAANWGNSKKKK